jgi:hypothetical protein
MLSLFFPWGNSSQLRHFAKRNKNTWIESKNKRLEIVLAVYSF